MIERKIAEKLVQMIAQYPVVSLTGPRQSGKTTLLKKLLPHYRYVSLENPDYWEFAETDPRRFLDIYSERVIFDEVQRVPKLFNYLQQRVDDAQQMGQFVLSGSQNFLLMRGITQSLAGRVAVLKLYPFAFGELAQQLPSTPEKAMFTGFYPPVYDRKMNPSDFYGNYFETYIQRDVRELQAVQNLGSFRTFVRLAAGRIGQPLNYQKLAADAGVSAGTAQAWLSILETSHLVFTLPPYFKNFSKRLTKTPKLYFYDIGLACYLVGIRQPDDLITHHYRGNLFENMLIAELLKQQHNQGQSPELYFWQESNGHEIDVLKPQSNGLLIGEIKSAATLGSALFEQLAWFQKQTDEAIIGSYLWYAGNETQIRSHATATPWYKITLQT
jgi:hypothetical protein